MGIRKSRNLSHRFHGFTNRLLRIWIQSFIIDCIHLRNLLFKTFLEAIRDSSTSLGMTKAVLRTATVWSRLR
jgi:hypothetical protein